MNTRRLVGNRRGRKINMEDVKVHIILLTVTFGIWKSVTIRNRRDEGLTWKAYCHGSGL